MDSCRLVSVLGLLLGLLLYASQLFARYLDVLLVDLQLRFEEVAVSFQQFLDVLAELIKLRLEEVGVEEHVLADLHQPLTLIVALLEIIFDRDNVTAGLSCCLRESLALDEMLGTDNLQRSACQRSFQCGMTLHQQRQSPHMSAR
jgi:hypothetical protein